MLFELTKPGVLENVIIKAQHNCMSDQRVYSGKFIPIVHEYVLLVRKDAPLAVPLLIIMFLIRLVSTLIFSGLITKAIGDGLAKTGLLKGYALGRAHG